MRAYALAIAAAAVFAFSASQAVGMGLHNGRSVGYQDCRELRKACFNKEELREQVHGNCQRVSPNVRPGIGSPPFL
jgi:hypothetical protein